MYKNNKFKLKEMATPAPRKPILTSSASSLSSSISSQDDKMAFQTWLENIYDTEALSEEEINTFYDAIKYHGFDRQKMLEKLFQKIKDKKIAIQLVILCALRGPMGASKVKMLNGLTPNEMNIPASGQIKTENLSCSRITSSTADLAAYYLKKLKVPKRINHPCPAWLQFPGAGSIKMPQEYREHHMDFSKKFSPKIKGSYNEDIYNQMVENAYLDPRLKLFDL